jgi:hypothetical protein
MIRERFRLKDRIVIPDSIIQYRVRLTRSQGHDECPKSEGGEERQCEYYGESDVQAVLIVPDGPNSEA